MCVAGCRSGLGWFDLRACELDWILGGCVRCLYGMYQHHAVAIVMSVDFSNVQSLNSRKSVACVEANTGCLCDFRL